MPNAQLVARLLCAAVAVGTSAVVVRPAAAADGPADVRYDLIVRNGTVVDGTGAAGVRGDLAIKDGKLALVGVVPPGAAAAAVIDAAGRVVAPGFIDVHTHVDDDVLKSPAAENFVRDGVTTIVSGNCGGSVRDVAGYFAGVRKRGAGPNVATLYGHNTVLRAVKGDRKGELTPEQMAKAKGMVRQAMQDGAVGLSTGLIYNPGQFSSTEEIVELAKVAGEFGGVYASHMRSEGTNILAAIDEAVRVGREAKIRVEISHFKLARSAVAKVGGTPATLGKVEAARAAGLEVWLDQYPYTASSTTISTLLPDAALEDGVAGARKRLKDPAAFDKVLAEMVHEKRKTLGKDGTLAYVVVASCEAMPQYNGKNLVQIALSREAEARAGRQAGELLVPATAPASPATGPAVPAVAPATAPAPATGGPSLESQCRAALEIFKAGGASCVFHSMGDAEVEQILRSPLVGIASDSGLREFGVGVPHPRGYGTNARVLGRYVREKHVVSVEEAVRKMTSLPAHSFRFEDRGRLAVGLVADVTVFDPATVLDKATFEQPHQYPEGITDVIVNGVPVVRNGKLTGALPGKPVLGPGAAHGKDAAGGE
jgi:N-acyl-D-amino-acid deacylase